MKFRDLFFKVVEDDKDKEERHLHQHYNPYDNIGALMFGGYNSYSSNLALSLSAVYRCVEVISNGVAELPLYPYIVDKDDYKTKATQLPIYHILNRKPNNRMTRYTLLKTVVQSMLLRGNAYIYVKRKKGEISELIFVPDNYVSLILPQTIFDEIKYNIIGIGIVESKDLIHIRNFSFDGINGISTLQHAKETLQLANYSEEHAKSFFNGGCNVGGILRVESSLTTNQKRDLKQSWQAAFNPQTGQPNSIAILEGNMDFQKITIDPADAQLLETRKYSINQICQFFSVPPTMCFMMDGANYNTTEALMLSFLTQTLQPILVKIEEEFNKVLFADSDNIEVRFDTSKLLRTDKTALAEYYNKLFNIGVMSVNEIRKDLDMEETEDGNTHFIPANLLSITAAKNNQPANSAIHSEAPTDGQQPLNENTTPPQTEQKTARKKK